MSWESPIGMAIEQAVQEAVKGEEEAVVKYVVHFVPTINKEELIKALEYDRGQYDNGYADGRAARDAEIIRCKDCKWYAPSKNILGGKRPEGRCDYEGVWVVESDYCSRGERREDDR